MWAALQDCRRRKGICIPQPTERACEIRNEIGQISPVMDGEKVGRDAVTGNWRTREAARHPRKPRPESGGRTDFPQNAREHVQERVNHWFYWTWGCCCTGQVEKERRLWRLRQKEARSCMSAHGLLCNRTQFKRNKWSHVFTVGADTRAISLSINKL